MYMYKGECFVPNFRLGFIRAVDVPEGQKSPLRFLGRKQRWRQQNKKWEIGLGIAVFETIYLFIITKKSICMHFQNKICSYIKNKINHKKDIKNPPIIILYILLF